MKNFAEYLQRAIRTGEQSSATHSSSSRVDVVQTAEIDPTVSTVDLDWSSHYVDYAMLKTRIASYAKRRMKLAEIVQGGDKVYLTEEDLTLVLSVGTTDQNGEADGIFLPMMMSSDESSGIADAIATKMASCGRCDDYFEYIDGCENGACF